MRAWVDRIKSSTGGWGGAFSFLFASFLVKRFDLEDDNGKI